jgi:branched-chain amino acid transport system permease protein
MSEVLLQTIVNAAVLSMLYTLLALGLTLFQGVMNIMFFPHGSMYMIGAFSIYYLSVVFGLNYFLAGIIVIIAVALFGMLLERGIYRPINFDVNRTFFLGVGVQWFLESSGYLVFGLQPRGVPTVFKGTIDFFGAVLTWQRLAVILISIIAVGLLQLFLTRSRLGLGMRCYVEDVDAAALQGIKPNTITTMTFIIGVGLAALAGVLVAPMFDIQASMGGPVVFNAFLIIGLGGLGSIPGAVLASVIIGFLNSFGATYIGPELTGGLVFAIIVIFLMIRPRGLMGVNR